MITLGVDPSLNGFGWCVHNSRVVGPQRVLGRGVFNTKGGLFVVRYAELRARLLGIIEDFPQIEAVGVESPVYGEQWSSGAYALFIYVNEALYLARKNVVYFDPITLKMLAKMDPEVRKGSMDKTDMIEAARADTSIGVWDHNEADGYIIARSAASFWEFEAGILKHEDLVPAEQHAFHRVREYKRGAKAGKIVKEGLVFRENDRFFKFSEVPQTKMDEELATWLRKRTAGDLLPQPKPKSPRRKSQ